MEKSFLSLVDEAKSILILLPSKPYFDQVAAALSLYLSLTDVAQTKKKSVTISSAAPITVGFNRLIGVNKITSEIGNKNLSITFANYDANNIEKVSYDIENGEFKLTVVPKIGLVGPQKEQIVIANTGVSADLVILIGGANESHFPILTSEDLSGAKIAHLGTRVLNNDKYNIMSFAKPTSSVSELVASLIKETSLPMDVDSATNLVMGIEDGSNHFESSEVTPETFEIFAHLLRNGGKRPPKTQLEPRNFPLGAIPTKPFNRPVMEQVENKEEVTENPPADWLQSPKVYKSSDLASSAYKGTSIPQPDSFSENKG